MTPSLARCREQHPRTEDTWSLSNAARAHAPGRSGTPSAQTPSLQSVVSSLPPSSLTEEGKKTPVSVSQSAVLGPPAGASTWAAGPQEGTQAAPQTLRLGSPPRRPQDGRAGPSPPRCPQGSWRTTARGSGEATASPCSPHTPGLDWESSKCHSRPGNWGRSPSPGVPRTTPQPTRKRGRSFRPFPEAELPPESRKQASPDPPTLPSGGGGEAGLRRPEGEEPAGRLAPPQEFRGGGFVRKKAPYPTRWGTFPHPTPGRAVGFPQAERPRPSPSRWGVRAEPTPRPPLRPLRRPASPGARPRPTCAPSSSSVCPSSSSSPAAAVAAAPRGISEWDELGRRRCGAVKAAAGGAWRRRRERTRVRPRIGGGRVGTGWRETGARAAMGEGWRRLHAPALRQSPTAAAAAAAPRSLRNAAALHNHGVRGHGSGLRFPALLRCRDRTGGGAGRRDAAFLSAPGCVSVCRGCV